MTGSFPAGSDADLKKLLRKRFTDWNIIHSTTGRWWAFRLPSRDDLNRVSDVDANTPAELYLNLLDIERRRTLRPLGEGEYPGPAAGDGAAGYPFKGPAAFPRPIRRHE